MSGTYIQYPPQATGGSTTGSQTGVPYNVGSLDGALASPNGAVIGSLSLYLQSASTVNPGLVSSAVQSFAGTKTFTAPVLISAGTLTNPGLAFSSDAGTGFSLNSSADMYLAISGIGVMEFKGLGAGLVNIGVNSSASSSALAPWIINRTQNASVGYTFNNFSNGNASGTVLNVANGPGTNNTTLENWANTTTGYLAGGSAIFAGTNQTFLAIGSEVASSQSFIGFTTRGRTLATERMRLNEFFLTLRGGIGLQITGSSVSGGVITHLTNNSTSSYNLTWPGAQGAAGTAPVNNGSGVLSWTATLTNPMTTSGDIIIGSGSGTAARLGIGLANQFLTVASGSQLPAWQSLTFGVAGTTPNTSGASLSGLTITLQPADANDAGLVSTAAQTFAGVKTFNAAPNLNSLSPSAQLMLDGSKNIVVGSVNLTTQVTGNLPLSQTSGSLSLTTQVVGVLPPANGGYINPLTTSGDLIVGSGSGVQTRLATGQATQRLTVSSSSGLPAWAFEPQLQVDKITAAGSTTWKTSSFITPTTVFKMAVVGGGGGGGGAVGVFAAAGGGGGGGTTVLYISSLTANTTYTVIIGSGGPGGSIAGGAGITGSASSITLPVGIGGANVTYQGLGGGAAGGTTATSPSVSGGGTGSGIGSNGSVSGLGTVIAYNGGFGSYGCSFVTGVVVSGQGGTSYYGGGSITSGAGSAGGAGTSPGAGGGGAASGSVTGQLGGAGQAGIIAIEWFQ